MNSWKSFALACEKATVVIDGKVSAVANTASAIVVIIDAVFLLSDLLNAIAIFGSIRLNS
jgi:hypothetical protein